MRPLDFGHRSLGLGTGDLLLFLFWRLGRGGIQHYTQVGLGKTDRIKEKARGPNRAAC